MIDQCVRCVVIDALIATMFYYELDGSPLFDSGSYQLSGNIFCRMDLPLQGHLNLYNKLYESRIGQS
jgi:hypothetical protein